MKRLVSAWLILAAASLVPAQQRPSDAHLPREQWGAPPVSVARTGSDWVIAGKKQRVTFNSVDLSLRVGAGAAVWSMTASLPDDLLVKSHGEEFYLRLADAGRIDVEPYDTGFKAGIKITLGQFRHAGLRRRGAPLDLTLFLTAALEGEDEELVFEAAAAEGEAIVRQLDWPKELKAGDAEYTVLSNRKGTLLPRDWPREYTPIRAMTSEGKIDPKDISEVESNLIESWSMSWWGFQKGPAAMMIIVETPEDAAYKFRHPAGGPTVIGPRWRATLGRFGYPRAARMVFFEKGDYVTLAKRYRRHVMDSGQFVGLRQKIVREPLVRELIGTPHIRQHALRNYRPGGYRYDPKSPERNYQVVTFDERAAQLRELKERGLDRMYVCLAAWPYRGYDRQHPDELPPAPEAGGWEGLKRYAATLRELGYLFVPHDQYRDYYDDAPSFQRQFAIHDEDMVRPAKVFPGSRFGEWKEGYVPFMDHWDGGKMGFLNPRFMLGHLMKNYRLMLRNGVKPQGVYLDVFGYIPPDEDFNPEHPATRGDSMRFRAACFQWVRNNLGLVGTESAADWTIPYVDFGSSNPGLGNAIPVPLYELVYHDAIVLPFSAATDDAARIGLLYGGVPQVQFGQQGALTPDALARIKRMAALHARVGLSEMTDHAFLDAKRRKERTTFADGTTVTVDHDAASVEIKPNLN